MKPGRGPHRVAFAVVGALVAFCLVATAIYARMADVGVNGWMHGGPAMLSAAMAGLFGGGVAALVMLIILLRPFSR